MHHVPARIGRLIVVTVVLATLVVHFTTLGFANHLGFIMDGQLDDLSGVTQKAIGTDATGATDDSFGGGTNEDDPAVTVGVGSIPNSKSDLTKFAAAYKKVSVNNELHDVLYVFWQRGLTGGTANMDFEFNAVKPVFPTSGAYKIPRTDGDLLITFDMSTGGNNVTLALLKWVTSGSASQCFKANKLPCWGNRVVLIANSTSGVSAEA